MLLRFLPDLSPFTPFNFTMPNLLFITMHFTSSHHCKLCCWPGEKSEVVDNLLQQRGEHIFSCEMVFKAIRWQKNRYNNTLYYCVMKI